MKKIYPILFLLATFLCSCRKEMMPSGVPFGLTSGYLISIEQETDRYPEKWLFEWKDGRVVGYNSWIYDSESDSYRNNGYGYTVSDIEKDKNGRVTSMLVYRTSSGRDSERARFCFEYDREGHLTSMIGVPLKYIYDNSRLRYVEFDSIKCKWEKGNLIEIKTRNRTITFSYSDVKNKFCQYPIGIADYLLPQVEDYFPGFLFLSGMTGKGPDMLPSSIFIGNQHLCKYEFNNDGTISREIIDGVSYKYKYRF